MSTSGACASDLHRRDLVGIPGENRPQALVADGGLRQLESFAHQQDRGAEAALTACRDHGCGPLPRRFHHGTDRLRGERRLIAEQDQGAVRIGRHRLNAHPERAAEARLWLRVDDGNDVGRDRDARRHHGNDRIQARLARQADHRFEHRPITDTGELLR